MLGCRVNLASSWLGVCRMSSSSVNPTSNHYSVLGVSPKANQAEIKAAYYKLSKKYHPDVNNSEEAANIFRAINEAYEVVSNVQLKKLYDKGVLARKVYTRYHPEMRNDGSVSNTAVKQPGEGKTTVYDFDAWTQHHYGKNFERKQAEMREVKFKEQSRKIYTSDKNSKAIQMMCVMIVSIFTLMAYGKDDYDQIVNKKKSES